MKTETSRAAHRYSQGITENGVDPHLGKETGLYSAEIHVH
jgi:hypothetical protein